MSVDLGPGGTVGATRIGGNDASSLLALLQQRPAWWADALCQEYPAVSWFPKREGSVDQTLGGSAEDWLRTKTGS